QLFESIRETGTQGRPRIRQYLRPAGGGRRNHRCSLSRAPCVKPILPERKVSDDFRNGMIDSGDVPFGIFSTQTLNHLLRREEGHWRREMLTEIHHWKL